MKQAIGIALELGEEDLLAELVTAAKENASVCSETRTNVCVNMLYVGGCVCGEGSGMFVLCSTYLSQLAAVNRQSPILPPTPVFARTLLSEAGTVINAAEMIKVTSHMVATVFTGTCL